MSRHEVRLARASFRFARPATTSRGTLLEKRVAYLRVSESGARGVVGIGECSLFPGLSADDRPGFDSRLEALATAINEGEDPAGMDLADWPSIAFGLETALADLAGGGRRLLFPSPFTKGTSSIPINGLIWMGSAEDMKAQIRAKLGEGFHCLKLKIGSSAGKGGAGLAFEEEFAILAQLRREFAEGELELRVDANGAFTPEEAPRILDSLASLRIHSIEQPIRAGQIDEMARLCADSPLPIALDEELIGLSSPGAKARLLDAIRPHFLILKPGLLGGLRACDEWIDLAGERGIGWWATSALETAVGLNAVAQWVATKANPLRQGLSTGKIFETTIPSPLSLEGEGLFHRPERAWDLSFVEGGSKEEESGRA